jgi:hypothetical protein
MSGHSPDKFEPRAVAGLPVKRYWISSRLWRHSSPVCSLEWFVIQYFTGLRSVVADTYRLVSRIVLEMTIQQEARLLARPRF